MGIVGANDDHTVPRPAAKGTELCLFSGEKAVTRVDLIAQLEALRKNSGRRFVTSAKARVGDAHLLVDGVSDEGDVTVIATRRPKLGYNQSEMTGDTTTFRNKRIEQW